MGRMREFVLALVLAATCCAVAEESYIYWMVDWDATLDGRPLTGSANARFVAYADPGTWSDGICLQPFVQDYTSGGLTPVELAPAFPKETQTFRIADLTDDSPRFAWLNGQTADDVRYYVEILNDSGDLIGRSTEGISYSTAFANEYVLLAEEGVQQLEPAYWWSVTTFASVPEPNSALLTALGLVLLALRRRPHA